MIDAFGDAADLFKVKPIVLQPTRTAKARAAAVDVAPAEAAGRELAFK